MTLYWKIPYSLTLRAPWVTPGDAAPGPSTDIVLARNQKRQFILPATLIKGNLRAAVDTLVEENAASRDDRDILFGTPSATRAKGRPEHPWRVANEPERGGLIFGDLVADEIAETTGGRTQRVKIDTDLGAAREGHLLFVECPYDFGTEVKFSGEVILWGHLDVEVANAVALLDQALGRVFAIGGMKSVGFGEVARYKFEEPRPVVPVSVSAPAFSLAMEYQIDRPFIVDATRHSGNLSVGSDIIPGSAIKAVLARGCEAAGIDAQDFFSQLNISHAAPNGRKPLPLSLSVHKDGEIKTAYCNLDGKIREGFHKFYSDWKKAEKCEEKLREKLGADWQDHATRLSGRSRTAIDSLTLTSSFEPGGADGEGVGQLFSQMSVVPDDVLWRGRMSAPDNPDCNTMFSKVLGLIASGLPGLGKTGAVLTGAAQIHTASPPPEGTLNLTLTSDACLFKPQDAVGANVSELYRRYFDKLGFELENFFATQVLKGGYLALRYPAIREKYIPWVLTCSGSVFKVKPNGKANIADIIEYGLPPADGLSVSWKEFPFLRENGFGRVENDILDHAQLAKGWKL